MAGLELVIGTYEQFTVCYRVEPLHKDPSKLHLKETFAAHLHTGSVRSIASNGKYVATGGADDRVCLLDVMRGSQAGEFLHHDGTVHAVCFSKDGNYLFTGGSDGTMTAINTATQAVTKTWKGAHKNSIQAISIHPNGKMAISLGGDMVLKTWDLITGRTLFTTSLHKNSKYGRSLTDVQWSPDGEHFALLGTKVVDVISIETTRSVRTIECDAKPTSMCWLSPEEIAVGLESGTLLMANIYEETQLEKLPLYETRLKAIACLDDYIATASSAGEVSLWRLEDVDFTQICTHQVGCRPICLTLMNSGKYELQQEAEPQQERRGSEKLPDDDDHDLPTTSASSIAKRVVQDLAWVTVETEDPIQQLAAAKQASKGSKGSKGVNRKRPIGDRLETKRKGKVAKKRTNAFTEEPIEKEVSDSGKVARNMKNKKGLTNPAKKPKAMVNA